MTIKYSNLILWQLKHNSGEEEGIHHTENKKGK